MMVTGRSGNAAALAAVAASATTMLFNSATILSLMIFP
jgi:hypothetical protein